MPKRVRVDQLYHSQRFWIASPERTWVRIQECDVDRGCAIAPEAQRTTPDARPYQGLFVGRAQIVPPQMLVVPL